MSIFSDKSQKLSITVIISTCVFDVLACIFVLTNEFCQNLGQKSNALWLMF